MNSAALILIDSKDKLVYKKETKSAQYETLIGSCCLLLAGCQHYSLTAIRYMYTFL